MIATACVMIVIVACGTFVGYVAVVANDVREEIARERRLADHRAQRQRLVRAQQARIRADRARIQAELRRQLETYYRSRPSGPWQR